MFPTVIHEMNVSRFAYWDGQIKKGMRVLNDLYTHVAHYPRQERTQAYEAGNQLASTGRQVCITVSKEQYCLWVSLRRDDSVAVPHG